MDDPKQLEQNLDGCFADALEFLREDVDRTNALVVPTLAGVLALRYDITREEAEQQVRDALMALEIKSKQ